MNVLAVGAHPDDVELACGATLAKHAAAGDYVTVLHLSGGVGSRQEPDLDGAKRRRYRAAKAAWGEMVRDGISFMMADEFPDQRFDTLPFLDIVQRVERAGPFDVVYTHHDDLNLDHAITARAVKTAFRPKPGVRAPKILAFEVLSSTELGEPFCPNVYVEVSPEMLERKVKALEAYGDEIPVAPHPRSMEAVRALACLRGAAVGRPFAEAFELVREVIG